MLVPECGLKMSFEDEADWQSLMRLCGGESDHVALDFQIITPPGSAHSAARLTDEDKVRGRIYYVNK
jgi:hypothetical protein